MTDADCFVFNADFTRREKIFSKFLLIQQFSKLDDLLMESGDIDHSSLDHSGYMLIPVLNGL